MFSFGQHPLIALIFSVVTLILIIQQSVTKHHLFKLKLTLALIVTFLITFILIMYNEIGVAEWLKNVSYELVDWALFALDIITVFLLFSTIDFSFTAIHYQEELNKTIDENKFYVVLDKKDRIKNISSLMLNDLNAHSNDVYGKNFFDSLEIKYRIVGLNGQELLKDDIKKYYQNYSKEAKKGSNNKLEITLQNEVGVELALYLIETPLFSGDKYQGRILIGEKKTEENLMGMESDLKEASEELDILRARFITILEKTNEGIYFANLEEGYIWFNDVLVKRLSLSGNNISLDEFYSLIHKEDINLYREKMTSNINEYDLKYRFNTGSSYIYVEERGKKISSGKSKELCGIIMPIDDYGFSKTQTLLDQLSGEPEMLARLKQLENDDKIFQAVVFKITSVPEINDKFGRAIGNLQLAQYVNFFRQNFVTDNQIYRTGGLEFVAFVTDYRKMDILKNNLYNGEKILHSKSTYATEEVDCEVFMGISSVDDELSHKNCLANAYKALKFASNPQFKSNFAYYKDVK